MKNLCWSTKIVTMLIMVGFLAGCAGTPPMKHRFYWPPLPDEPKIEWLGAYRSQHDLPKTGSQLFFESIFGKDDPITFNRPTGIAADGEGLVYVCDPLNHAIVVYDLKNNKVHLFGKNLEQLLQEPMGIDIDGAGNIYIVDADVKKIFIFNKEEKPVGNIDLSAFAKRPIGIAIDKERKRIIVCDSQGNKIEVIDLAGKQLFSFGKRGGGDGEFNVPAWATVLTDGTIVVSDSLNARIQLFDNAGKFISKFGKRGDNPGEFQMIKGIARDMEDHIYVVDGKGNNFSVYSPKGEYLTTVGGAFPAEYKIAPGGFLLPMGIFIDKNNTIYVVDQMNYRFQVFQYLDERYLKKHPVETGAALKENAVK